eukprot:365796-Chlamydomonas_euryale.AAC.17
MQRDGGYGAWTNHAVAFIKLSGKELLVTDGFKYLGSFFADDESMSREMDVWNVHALAIICQFQYIWDS